MPTATLDPLGSRTEAQIAMPGGPDVPIDAFGSMWFLTPDAPVIGVTRLDPATNEIVATIGGGSAACEAMGATGDAIWMCTTKGLARIDPETNEVTSQLEFPTGEAFGYLPYDGSSLWALSGQGTLTGDLVRIDPAANRITGTYPLGFGAAFMTYGEGAIWLSDSAAGVLWRFDPETQELTEHVSDLPQPGPSAVGAGSIWLALRADDERRPVPTEVTLVRIDPTSGEIEAEFATGGTVQGGLVHVADDQVLVRASAPFLTYIDVATNEITDTLQVDRAGGSVTVAHGSIWATSTDYSTVWRLAR